MTSVSLDYAKVGSSQFSVLGFHVSIKTTNGARKTEDDKRKGRQSEGQGTRASPRIVENERFQSRSSTSPIYASSSCRRSSRKARSMLPSRLEANRPRSLGR